MNERFGTFASAMALAVALALPARAAEPSPTTVDVKAFGAKGDGVADDTAAIRRAIAAASNAPLLAADNNLGGSGAEVVFPRGVYRVTGTLAIQHDGVSLVGYGPAVSVIKADADATTDVMRLGPVRDGQSGRRSTIRDLGILAEDTTKSRDAIWIEDTTWWRIDNVQIFRAGRHGLRVGGTLNGVASKLRIRESGDSGVLLDKSQASGTGLTTTTFYDLYSYDNRKHGVLVRRGHHVTFFAPILEYNGKGGVEGCGIKIGDASSDGASKVQLFSPYFENNAGWDIWSGDVPTPEHASRVYVYGADASSDGRTKLPGQLHVRQDYGVLEYYGGRVSYAGQPAGVIQLNLYATDPRGAGGATGTTILGISGVTAAALPTYRVDGVSQDLNAFNGRVEWPDGGGHITTYGRYVTRLGGPTAAPSVALFRSTSIPTQGTWSVGDFALNASADRGRGARPIGWRCTAPGTPGTWEEIWGRPTPAGHVVPGYGRKIDVDASAGDSFDIRATDRLPFTIESPRNPAPGQRIAVRLRNESGAALGTVTWGAAYKLSQWRSPSPGHSRSVSFVYDGAAWIEESRTSEDVPN